MGYDSHPLALMARATAALHMLEPRATALYHFNVRMLGRSYPVLQGGCFNMTGIMEFDVSFSSHLAEGSTSGTCCFLGPAEPRPGYPRPAWWRPSTPRQAENRHRFWDAYRRLYLVLPNIKRRPLFMYANTLGRLQGSSISPSQGPQLHRPMIVRVSPR